jgi:hypothetical protein
LFLILGAISIIIIFYLRRELSLWIDSVASAIKVRIRTGMKTEILLWINALVSPIKARISKKTKTETPPTTYEPFKEAEIRPDEPSLQVQEQDMLGKVYAHLENLIEQKQFRESISFSYKNAKEHVSTCSGVKSTLQQTHWDYYNLVKSSLSAVADDFLELTQLYETAMYSIRKVDAEQAEKAVELLRKIYTLSNEKNK